MAGVRNARGLAEKTRAMLFALVIITSGILITLVQLLMLPISMILDRSLFVVLRLVAGWGGEEKRGCQSHFVHIVRLS